MDPKEFKKFSDKYIRGDNWHNIDFSRGNLGYGWVHYGLICSSHPKRILCIGSKWGFVPAICAMACRDMGGGSVDFVDASFDLVNDGSKSWGGVGNWKKVDKDKYFYPLGKYIDLHVCTTEDFCKKKENNEYDYVYVDGDHSLLGVTSDYLLLWPRLKKGGYMLFHDIHGVGLVRVYGSNIFWKIAVGFFEEKLSIAGVQGLGVVKKYGSLKENIFYWLLYFVFSCTKATKVLLKRMWVLRNF